MIPLQKEKGKRTPCFLRGTFPPQTDLSGKNQFFIPLKFPKVKNMPTVIDIER
jgi:hypothetical protein